MVMKSSKLQRNKQRFMPRFMLQGPRPFTILFFAHTLCTKPTRFYWLVSPTEVNTFCVLSMVKPKISEQKHKTKNFCQLHKHSSRLTTLKVFTRTPCVKAIKQYCHMELFLILPNWKL